MPKFTKHLKKNRINKTMKRVTPFSRQQNKQMGGDLKAIINAARAAKTGAVMGYNAARASDKLSNIKNVSNLSDLKNQINKSGILNNVNNIGKQVGFDTNKYYNDNLKGTVDNLKGRVNDLTNKFNDGNIPKNLDDLKSKATSYYNTNLKDKVNDLTKKFNDGGIQDNINQFKSKATDYYNTNLKGRVDELKSKLKNGESQGVLDMVGNTILGTTSYIGKQIADNGLSLVGLERIDNSQGEPSRVVSDAKNFANRASAAAINNINKVLGSEAVSQTVEQAGKNTALITGKLADNFNRAMEDPVLKAKVKKAIENAGEIGSVVAKAAEEPIKNLARVSGKAATTAFGAASSGAIKVVTDMLGAIPGVGGIIDIGKAFNDGTRAIGAGFGAGTKVFVAASKAIVDTTENVEEELKNLEEKKQMSQEISNRTNQSIKDFENPQQVQVGGFNKTKRKFTTTMKTKSRKVRFAI